MSVRGRAGRWVAVAAAAVTLTLPGVATAQAAPARHAPHTTSTATTAHAGATTKATTTKATTAAAGTARAATLHDQPELAGVFVPTAPVRLLDTRNGTGTAKGKVGQTPVQLDVSGVSGDPAVEPTAVVLNVTVTGATTAGHLAVYPGDQQPPGTSNLNFSAGQTVPNLVTVPVGADGRIAFVNAFGSTDVIADLAGYYTTVTNAAPGGTYVPQTPKRLLDTRYGTGTGVRAAVGPNGTVTLRVAGVAPVPAADVSAVVLNVTVTAPTTSSYLTVYPHGGALPTASNLNFIKGRTVSNLVTVRLGGDGAVSFHNAFGSTQVIADLAGYYVVHQPRTGAVFQRTDAPTRVLDTRDGTGTGGVQAPIGAGGTLALDVTGTAGVPARGVSAVVLNVTVADPTTSSYLTVYPSGAALPTASNLNFTKGQVVPNLVVVAVGADGRVNLRNAFGTTHVVADVLGWFSGGAGLELTALAFTQPPSGGSSNGVALSWGAADSDPAVTELSGDLVLRQQGTTAGTFTGPSVVVPFTTAHSVTGGGTLASGGPAGATWTYALILPKHTWDTEHWKVVSASLRESATGARALVSGADLDSFADTVSAQVEPTGHTLAATDLMLSTTTPRHLPYVYDGALTHAAYTFTVPADAGLWKGDLTLGGPVTLITRFEMSTFAGQPDGPCVPGTTAGTWACTVQAEIPAGTPDGVYHLISLYLYDSTGQLHGTPVTGVQALAATGNKVLRITAFSGGTDSWRGPAPYTVKLDVTGDSGGLQAVYLSWTGQPACTQVSTAPHSYGGGHYGVDAMLPQSFGTPAACRLTGAAALRTDGTVALYGPDFDAPDPGYTAYSAPDTTPPTIDSASLYRTSFRYGVASWDDITIVRHNFDVPLSHFTATLYPVSGGAVYTASGGTGQEVNETVNLTFDIPATLPVGSYTVGFTITDAGGLSTSYGTGGAYIPGGPLTLSVTPT